MLKEGRGRSPVLPGRPVAGGEESCRFSSAHSRSRGRDRAKPPGCPRHGSCPGGLNMWLQQLMWLFPEIWDPSCGCILVTRALLFVVHMKAPDFWKLAHGAWFQTRNIVIMYRPDYFAHRFGSQIWVDAKELGLSYHNSEPLLFGMYPPQLRLKLSALTAIQNFNVLPARSHLVSEAWPTSERSLAAPGSGLRVTPRSEPQAPI